MYCSGICLQTLTEITNTTVKYFGFVADILTGLQYEVGVLPTERQRLVLLSVSTRQECCPLDGKIRYYSLCSTAGVILIIHSRMIFCVVITLVVQLHLRPVHVQDIFKQWDNICQILHPNMWQDRSRTRNTEVHVTFLPCKASNTHSEYVSEALVISHVKRIIRTILSSVACPDVQYFRRILHQAWFSENRFSTWNACFDLLFNFCLKHCLL
jgi:hypothetical protein